MRRRIIEEKVKKVKLAPTFSSLLSLFSLFPLNEGNTMRMLIIALFCPTLALAQVNPDIIWTNPDGSQVDITETVRPNPYKLHPDGVSDEELGVINPYKPKVIIDQREPRADPYWPRIDRSIRSNSSWLGEEEN